MLCALYVLSVYFCGSFPFEGTLLTKHSLFSTLNWCCFCCFCCCCCLLFYLFAANAKLADEFLCYCSTGRFLQLPAESVVIVARSFICQCLDLVLNRLTCVHVICLLPAAQLFWFIRVLYKFQCASSTLTSMLINEIIQTILKWLMTFELCALKCAFKWRIVKLFILLLCKCMAIFFCYCSCSFVPLKFRVQCTLNVYSPFWVDPFESSNDSKWYIFCWYICARWVFIIWTLWSIRLLNIVQWKINLRNGQKKMNERRNKMAWRNKVTRSYLIIIRHSFHIYSSPCLFAPHLLLYFIGVFFFFLAGVTKKKQQQQRTHT